ncbi:beta-ketoacyl synthase N-terminal-like domain-containing protein [Streptomyces agglomeratus]|uniref:beta-ketoacyl synthase N-terminal-like domain-containing protein n=1 Tax=Streptomyces agglomeratus TaxID=285458 RepID=UPI003CC7F8C5
MMDPQQRVFRETAWEAPEETGHTSSRLDALMAPDGTPGSVGVFVSAGAGAGDYALCAAESSARERQVEIPHGAMWRLSNRLSALLGFTGPSDCVDTAERSVPVAPQLAVAAMRRGECQAALVGGVKLLLDPSTPCPGAGEGVGALLVKPLERVLANGDTVHAVIRGCDVAYTAPGPGDARPGRRSRAGAVPLRVAIQGQAKPVSGSHGRRWADVPTDGVGASADAASIRPLAGDAGTAAGAAVLTRAVLQLRHRMLLPRPSRDEAERWPAGAGLPLRASAGLRGGGRVEVRVILEAHLCWARTAAVDGSAGSGAAEELFVLSAPTPAHLPATPRRFAELLSVPGRAPRPGALTRAVLTGRAALDCRLAVTATDIAAHLAGARAEFVQRRVPCADRGWRRPAGPGRRIRDRGVAPRPVAGWTPAPAARTVAVRAGRGGGTGGRAGCRGRRRTAAPSPFLPAFLPAAVWLTGAESAG